jgi:hypothetical protein
MALPRNFIYRAKLIPCLYNGELSQELHSREIARLPKSAQKRRDLALHAQCQYVLHEQGNHEKWGDKKKQGIRNTLDKVVHAFPYAIIDFRLYEDNKVAIEVRDSQRD